MPPENMLMSSRRQALPKRVVQTIPKAMRLKKIGFRI
jgi:hypothetical protein